MNRVKTFLFLISMILLNSCESVLTRNKFKEEVVDRFIDKCQIDTAKYTVVVFEIDSDEREFHSGLRDSTVVICYDVKNWSEDLIEVYFNTGYIATIPEFIPEEICGYGARQVYNCYLSGYWWYKPKYRSWVAIPPRLRM